jgi:hypothetical protein
MKKYLAIAFTIIVACCNAQTVVPLFGEGYKSIDGAYHKDTYNDLDAFTGTWEYTTGRTKLVVTIRKATKYHNELATMYEDLLYGEYKYIEKGVEKINTLPIFDTKAGVYDHNIWGNGIITAEDLPLCKGCPPGQTRVVLNFSDPGRIDIEGFSGAVVLRRVDEGTEQKIELVLHNNAEVPFVNGAPQKFTSFTVPFGTYILKRTD